MWGMTAAHPVLPLPTYVEVTNLDTGKKIVVKVNDRGPFLHNRIIDLSYAAAHKLGIAKRGIGRVEVRALDSNDDYGADDFTRSGPIIGSIGTVVDPQQEVLQGEFLVQIGVYFEFDNARAMRNRLIQSGYSIYPHAEQENTAPPYKVQVGPFKTADSALQIKQILERFLGQDLLLIQK